MSVSETYGEPEEFIEILSWTLSLEGAAQEEWFEFTKNSEIGRLGGGESKVYMDEGELKIPFYGERPWFKGRNTRASADHRKSDYHGSAEK